MIDTKELRRLAQAVSGWSNCNQAWLDQSEDVPAAVVGHIDEDGNTYPVATIDCDQYYAAHQSLPIAKFYAAANPLAIEELLDRLEAAEKDITLKERVIDSLGLGLNAAAHERDNLRAELSKQQTLTDAAQHIAEVAQSRANQLQASITEMRQPGAKWFDWLPQGTTHISSIMTVTIPCFGLDARFNAFKYIDGVLYTYRTDSDNKYGKWVKAASEYRDGVIPTIYPLSGTKGIKMTIDINELRQSLGAIQPEEVAELLDRLEATEKERNDFAQQLVQSEITRREISEAHNAVTRRLSVLADENTTLRARIEAMEKQKPVATVRINVINGNPSVDFVPGLHYLHHNDKLYLAPGAKGETK